MSFMEPVKDYGSFRADLERSSPLTGAPATTAEKIRNYATTIICSLAVLFIFAPGAFFCISNGCKLARTDEKIVGYLGLIGGLLCSISFFFKRRNIDTINEL